MRKNWNIFLICLGFVVGGQAQTPATTTASFQFIKEGLGGKKVALIHNLDTHKAEFHTYSLERSLFTEGYLFEFLLTEVPGKKGMHYVMASKSPDLLLTHDTSTGELKFEKPTSGELQKYYWRLLLNDPDDPRKLVLEFVEKEGFVVAQEGTKAVLKKLPKGFEASKTLSLKVEKLENRL